LSYGATVLFKYKLYLAPTTASALDEKYLILSFDSKSDKPWKINWMSDKDVFIECIDGNIFSFQNACDIARGTYKVEMNIPCL